MHRPVLLCSLLLASLPALVTAQTEQTQTEETNVSISGQTMVPVDTDNTPGPSAGDDGFTTVYVPAEDCFAVIGSGVLEPEGVSFRGVQSVIFSAFNFRQVEGPTGTLALEEIVQCGPYYDDRQRRYYGTLSNGSVAARQVTTEDYDTLTIQRQTFAPGNPLEPKGSGQLVDTNDDGLFDAVQGTMSDGMNLSVLVDMQFYPNTTNPTHLMLPGRFRGVFANAYIPVNPDGSITAVRADNNAPVGGVCLTSGVTVGALPTGCRLPAPGGGVDPVGIPLLSRWGMAGLMLTLLGVTVVGMRRLQS